MPELNEPLGTDKPAYVELGSSGLRRWGGHVDEEFLTRLKGRKGVSVFREMSDNDPIVGAMLFAVKNILRGTEFRVSAASDDFEDKRAAHFVETCMDDMSHPWSDFMTECLTHLEYGWSYHEIVYKRRVGDVRNPQFKSKYSDGMIGWRKIPARAQETLLEWKFDEDGGIQGLVQLAPPDFKRAFIPIDKALLFRTTSAKNNPEGRSLLRNAYRPWYFKKRTEEIEGIGIERDLAGLPVAYIPAEYLSPNAKPEEKAIADAFKKLVRQVRRDEQEGLVLPMEFDPDSGNELYRFELLNSGGTRQFPTEQVIQRYSQHIAMTILADFILLGHEKIGSYALSTSKTGIFRAALQAIVDNVADVFNRHAVPRLFELNNWKVHEYPTIEAGEVDPPDLNELSAFIQTLSGSGMPFFPDEDLEEFLRKVARLPERSESAKMEQEQKDFEAQQMAAFDPYGGFDDQMQGGDPMQQAGGF